MTIRFKKDHISFSDFDGGLLPGLYGKKYSGYFNDDPDFFASATQTDFDVSTSIVNFATSQNNYSWQWLGYIKMGSATSVNLQTTSDDASFVWAGATAVSGYTTGNAIVNNEGTHSPQTRNGVFTPGVSDVITDSRYTPIRIQYGNSTGGVAMTFEYAFDSGSYITDGTNNWVYTLDLELADQFDPFFGS